MKTHTTLATLAITALLAVPAGAATWMAYGTYEPDNSYDSASYMQIDPPVSGQHVYFNVYSDIQTAVGQGGPNPNVGAAKTRIEPFGIEEQYAVLGVWTDCNGDGYIGMAETAVREYPAALLLDNSRCPPTTIPNGNCWTTVTPCPSWPGTGYNNVRGWVVELIPIGDEAVTGGDKRLIKDPTAAIWGDYGRPDDAAAATDGGTCALTPLPRGTLATVGGMLTYADCTIGAKALYNEAWRDDQPIAGQPLPGLGDPLGLAFEDPNDGNSGTIGQVPTFGDESSDAAIVHAGDCSQPDSYLLAWPGGLPAVFYENFQQGIRNPDAAYVNPSGSIAGTVNYTREALPLPMVQTSDDVGPESTSNCDFDDDRGSDIYSLAEGDFSGTSVTDKRQSDWNFAFSTMSRGGAPLGVPFSSLGPTGQGFSSGAAGGAPDDAGLEPFNMLCLICQQSEWFGGSGLVGKTPQTLAVRGTALGMLRTGEPVGADIDGAYFLTFYATSSVLGTTAGSGEYASGQCGENEVGVHNGWNCEAALWNLNPDGSSIPDPNGAFSFPGKPYNMRDVDCYDGGIGEGDTAVGVEAPFYGAGACRPFGS